MFRKKSKESGNEGKSNSKKPLSFEYEIPVEYLDSNSDFGKPNFDNANSFATQVRFKDLLTKIKVVLCAILAIVVISCAALTFVLVFATDYEIAYVDDGTLLMCIVE